MCPAEYKKGKLEALFVCLKWCLLIADVPRRVCKQTGQKEKKKKKKQKEKNVSDARREFDSNVQHFLLGSNGLGLRSY